VLHSRGEEIVTSSRRPIRRAGRPDPLKAKALALACRSVSPATFKSDEPTISFARSTRELLVMAS